MKSLAEYEELARLAHGHLCAGQVLGLRMAMLALRLLGVQDPEGNDRKRLITIVEIDRCATDAIAVVTGCRPGKRTLKFRDFGKMAASFHDLATHRAVRIAALESAKERARLLHPGLDSRNAQQLEAYRQMPDEDLFSWFFVTLHLPPEDLPGYKRPAVQCHACGEHVHFAREVAREGRTLCRPCAGERYWEPE